MAERDPLGAQHPFFVPLYRRILLVCLCLGWSVFEYSIGSPGWSAFIGAIGVYSAYQFFFNWQPPEA